MTERTPPGRAIRNMTVVRLTKTRVKRSCGLTMLLHLEIKTGDPAMKKYILAVLVVGALATSAFGQSSLFDKYDVNMTKWAQLPADLPWGGLTTWVAADGKGTVIVLVRKAPYFRVFTAEGKFVKAWGDEDLFVEAHSVQF